ncbi:unnamed protein product [Polarella glacialis]|uniref:Uncharacterized protein n=1 Tax=Polarella glacialis TaxID=89957 RepID=A0A813K3G0_POLGL|nr:unnamed protein product [Polarella glacialis]
MEQAQKEGLPPIVACALQKTHLSEAAQRFKAKELCKQRWKAYTGANRTNKLDRRTTDAAHGAKRYLPEEAAPRQLVKMKRPGHGLNPSQVALPGAGCTLKGC